jgi:hypothetical protein
MIERKSAVRLRMRSSEVLAVQWTGDVRALPILFRRHCRESVFKGKLEVDRHRGWARVRRGNTVQGVVPGDWLVRDENGHLWVMGGARVSEDYEVIE